MEAARSLSTIMDDQDVIAGDGRAPEIGKSRGNKPVSVVHEPE
jgi:hypothetical protein